MNKKLVEFQKKLQNEGFNTFLITNPTNIYYFTKFLSRSSAYLIFYSESSLYLFVPELEYEDALNKVKDAEVVKIDRNSEVLQLMKNNLIENKVKRMGIEDNSMSIKFYQTLTEKYDFLKLENGSMLIDKLRATKITEEIEKVKKACQIADKGITIAKEEITEGKTENEIAAEVEYYMRKEGSEMVPFDTIIASGHRSALPHGVSSNKKIAQRELIIIDIGAKYEGYCSDITRTVVLGKPDQKQLEIYNAVLRTWKQAIRACSIGKEAGIIEKEARDLLSEEGLNNYFVHALGHGVGLDVHELPHIAERSKDILLENNIFTIEPGIYIPNFAGVRIEDMILLTKQGPKILTNSNLLIEI